MLILQNDPELIDWVFNLKRMYAGGFLMAIGEAAQLADHANYPLMRPLLLDLKKKYPGYDRKAENDESALLLDGHDDGSGIDPHER